MASYNYQDKTGLLYLLTRLKTFFDKKVDKVEGKGLSANDFTDELKKKLDDIAAEATKVIVDATLTEEGLNPVQGAAIYAELKKKAALESPSFTGLPTAPTAIEGDTSTQIATTAFVMGAIAKALGEVTGLSFLKVTELPETGQAGVIYLVPKEGSSSDVYEEYYWFEDSFEFMGTTAMDLSGYVKAEEMVPISTEEIDAMFADW